MDVAEICKNKQLTTEEKCIAYLERMRWPEGVACPQCGNKSVSSFQTTGKSGKVRHLYQCLEKACRYQFSPTTGTIFHDSHLPLSKWFSAIALIGDSKEPLSANQLRLTLGVQYKTAVHIMGRIRQAMANGTIELNELPASSAQTLRTVRETPGRRSARSRQQTRPTPAAASAALQARRDETADLLKQLASTAEEASATAVDNMLSMFVSLAQITVKPPLFFVNYLKDKVFT